MQGRLICPPTLASGPDFDRRQFLAAAGLTLSSAQLVAAAPLSLTLDPLNFIVVGDWGRDGKDYQTHVAAQMAQEAARTNARFVVSTGDNFYTRGVSSRNDRQWETSFENIYDRELMPQPWYPVLGNHDYGGNVFAQMDRTGMGGENRWHMPQRWHSIRAAHGRSDVDLFFVDTIAWTGHESLPWNLTGTSVNQKDAGQHKRDLMDTLLASTARFKLVFGHYPVYSVGPHGGKWMMTGLDALMRYAGVTAYICGHDHCLYHIRTSRMDYICSGGGSEELARFTGSKTAPGCVLPSDCPGDPIIPGRASWLSYADRAGFASFSIGAQSLRFRLIDRSGATFREEVVLPGTRDPSITDNALEEALFGKVTSS